jgi:pyruvate, orthophosphate dikinase
MALSKAKPIAKGLAASPGAACGKIYFTATEASAAAQAGEEVILVRIETSPEDIEGMYASNGILTARGGMTSHAAVVARGMGTCCVSGCGEIMIVEKMKTMSTPDGKVFREGDYISLDGSTGLVYGEPIATKPAELTGDFGIIMQWADEERTLKVRTNADTPKDAAQAIHFGAEGIGLCRTEHMFFDEERIPAMREMIVSKTQSQRVRALAKLLPMQKKDFKGIYEAMGEMPVTIRLLDPPLHEFLPHEEEDIRKLAKEMIIPVEELRLTISALHEFNPMMGHRGCRLAVSYPEIAEMQARAIMEAGIEVFLEKSISIVPEIMIPLIGDIKELKYVKDVVVKACEEVIAEKGVRSNTWSAR